MGYYGLVVVAIDGGGEKFPVSPVTAGRTFGRIGQRRWVSRWILFSLTQCRNNSINQM